MRRGKHTFKAVKMFVEAPEKAAGGILFGYSQQEVCDAIPAPTAPFYWRVLERRGNEWHVVLNEVRKK